MALQDIPQSSKISNRKATLQRPLLTHAGPGHQQAHDLYEGGSLCKAQLTCLEKCPKDQALLAFTRQLESARKGGSMVSRD